MLKRSGGQRQRIWNALLLASRPLSVAEIVAQAGGKDSSARTYLNGLAKNGYTVKDSGWKLLKKTGPEAPAFSVQTGEFRDWNVDRPMESIELQGALAEHGGSLAQFCRDIGHNEHAATRLRQMMAGQRPVTDSVKEAVLAWRKGRTNEKSPAAS